MKKILYLFIFLLLFPIVISAKTDDIQITSVELMEKTGLTEEISKANYDDLSLKLNVKFKKLNDSIKYKVVIKNDSSKEYKLNENLNNFNKDKYITYEFKYDNDINVIKSNESKTLYVYIKYANEVNDSDFVNDLYVNDNHMDFSYLIEESKIEEDVKKDNPNTSTGIIFVLYIVVYIASFVALIVFNKKKNRIISFICFVLFNLIPITISALESLKINVDAHVEIEKVEYGVFTLDCSNLSVVNTYDFEIGMTWKEWFDSDYNIDGLEASNEIVSKYDPNYYYQGQFISNVEDFSEKIENNKEYFCYPVAECVAPDSELLTAINGNVKLAKDMKENDSIVYFDYVSNSLKEGKVKQVFIHKNATNFVKYHFGDGSYLEVTDYHPIYTKDGWKSYTRKNGYEQPVIGDLVQTNNLYKKIIKIDVYNGKEDFYDFMVVDENDNIVDNYYANSILVQSSY